MTRDDSVYLRHILDAIGKIESYLEGVSESGFQTQSLIQDGTIRQLEVIGEAVRHLSRQLRDDHPEVPWADIAGMRSKLIHDYFGVDVEVPELPGCFTRGDTLDEIYHNLIEAIACHTDNDEVQVRIGHLEIAA